MTFVDGDSSLGLDKDSVPDLINENNDLAIADAVTSGTA